MSGFVLHSKFEPAGDQPTAINELLNGLANNRRNQTLLGVTGSGKTFTMANVIRACSRPVIIMAHNKTLAAQLYSEMKEFFPNNAVEYFVSYYDYYQPEAYIPQRDAYIEKDSQINEQIDRMRHSATRALLERRDVIVVASVSCIYGLGTPELYLQAVVSARVGDKTSREHIMHKLIELQYTRNDVDFRRGFFRVRGDNLDIFPSHYEDMAWRVVFFGDEIEKIYEIDALTGSKKKQLEYITVFANSHYVTPKSMVEKVVQLIMQEMKDRVTLFNSQNRLIEAQRIEQRTRFDLEMMMQTGSCKGIENYSRYFSGRAPGEPPPTLFEYLPKDGILFIDESHVTTPQIMAMYNGDRARKMNLVEYGFRLPSALDNRPLKFEEWDAMRPNTIFVSATPGNLEMKYCNNTYVRQVIRPTGLLDPICEVRSADTQVDDLLAECRAIKASGQGALVTTLTKKMAEDLAAYLREINISAVYLHSDVKTLERVEIIMALREGKYDVLVGVNLLREGLDIPECSLVAILDADKEGFLRSETSLIQTIGRAARNASGRVLLYANRITGSMKAALDETARRREIQMEYNVAHNISPKTIKKATLNVLQEAIVAKNSKVTHSFESLADIEASIKKLHSEMKRAASDLDFEHAASLRDQIKELEKLAIELY